MRGMYHMRDWEIAKYKSIIFREIERIKVLPSYRRSFVEENVCPANIIQTLEALGWERVDFDSNGWEQDTWYCFSHPDYDFQLILFYCGYTYDIELYRTED